MRNWVFKVVVGGDGGSGKSTLIQRFATGIFQDDIKMTIGTDFVVQEIDLADDFVKMQLWDFAGEERFRTMLPMYCRGAAGAILCYDITDYSTFEHISEWLNLTRGQCGSIPTILVGNKFDLPDHEVSSDVADKYAKDAQCIGNVWTSSKTGLHVDHLFQSMAEWLVYYGKMDNE